MGIVKISEELHQEARVACKAMSRSINAQAEHWMKIGMFIEANPDLSYHDACRHFLQQARAADDADMLALEERAS